MSGECVTLSEAKIRELARSACLAVGASDATAESLIDATISAERFGRAEVGFFHFVDYLDGMSCGRIRGDARPQITFPLPAVVAVDANDGIAQLGFDLAYDEVVLRARQFGIALFTQKNSFTAGELGYFVRRLAKDGLVGLAATNGPPLLAASAGRRGVYCTNPLAVGAPSADPEGPIVIDQASSITSYVNVALAAAEGKAIPHGWATDAEGIPTTDAQWRVAAVWRLQRCECGADGGAIICRVVGGGVVARHR